MNKISKDNISSRIETPNQPGNYGTGNLNLMWNFEVGAGCSGDIIVDFETANFDIPCNSGKSGVSVSGKSSGNR